MCIMSLWNISPNFMYLSFSFGPQVRAWVGQRLPELVTQNGVQVCFCILHPQSSPRSPQPGLSSFKRSRHFLPRSLVDSLHCCVGGTKEKGVRKGSRLPLHSALCIVLLLRSWKDAKYAWWITWKSEKKERITYVAEDNVDLLGN